MKANGVLNLYKPVGMTSHTAVSTVKRLLGAEKAGHCGTLDPDASGVLPVMLGSSVKLSEYLTDHDKRYTARLVIGYATDTGDVTGKKTAESGIFPSFAEIKEAASSFVGGYDQIPPMYSSLKVNGVKLVNAARKCVEIERAPRHIDIYSIDVYEKEDGIYLDVECSRGTYIRTLCEDIAKKAGTLGCMGSLERSRVGAFDISSSVTLEMLKDTDEEKRLSYLIPAEDVLSSLPSVRLTPFFENLIRNGCAVDVRKIGLCGSEVGNEYRVYGEKGFFAVGRIIDSDGVTALKHEKIFF